MKTIVLENHKGGCAKKTTAFNIAVSLASGGARVLVVDQQGNLSAAFAGKWDGRYPSISKSWRTNWARVILMFGFP